MIDFFGHIFYLLIAIGIWFLAYGRPIGFVFQFIGNTGWAILGVYLDLSSIWTWEIIFNLLVGYGFWNWTWGPRSHYRKQKDENKFSQE